ncbi:MAG: hypothetical protein HOO06_00125 [Bdellovibrionaceae bacterium]|nr:hypothetical protein [Pseudobdellovibrionaceae bacterium]
MTIELIKIINLVKNKTTRALKSLTLASSLGAINILMFFGIVVLLSGCGKNFSPSKDFKMAIQNKSKNTKDNKNTKKPVLKRRGGHVLISNGKTPATKHPYLSDGNQYLLQKLTNIISNKKITDDYLAKSANSINIKYIYDQKGKNLNTIEAEIIFDKEAHHYLPEAIHFEIKPDTNSSWKSTNIKLKSSIQEIVTNNNQIKLNFEKVEITAKCEKSTHLKPCSLVSFVLELPEDTKGFTHGMAFFYESKSKGLNREKALTAEQSLQAKSALIKSISDKNNDQSSEVIKESVTIVHGRSYIQVNIIFADDSEFKIKSDLVELQNVADTSDLTTATYTDADGNTHPIDCNLVGLDKIKGAQQYNCVDPKSYKLEASTSTSQGDQANNNIQNIPDEDEHSDQVEPTEQGLKDENQNNKAASLFPETFKLTIDLEDPKDVKSGTTKLVIKENLLYNEETAIIKLTPENQRQLVDLYNRVKDDEYFHQKMRVLTSPNKKGDLSMCQVKEVMNQQLANGQFNPDDIKVSDYKGKLVDRSGRTKQFFRSIQPALKYLYKVYDLLGTNREGIYYLPIESRYPYGKYIMEFADADNPLATELSYGPFQVWDRTLNNVILGKYGNIVKATIKSLNSYYNKKMFINTEGCSHTTPCYSLSGKGLNRKIKDDDPRKSLITSAVLAAQLQGYLYKQVKRTDLIPIAYNAGEGYDHISICKWSNDKRKCMQKKFCDREGLKLGTRNCNIKFAIQFNPFETHNSLNHLSRFNNATKKQCRRLDYAYEVAALRILGANPNNYPHFEYNLMDPSEYPSEAKMSIFPK